MENSPEKEIFRRRETPLKVSLEKVESSKKYIEKLKQYTDKVKQKYPLNDFTEILEEMVKEKGKEYNFEEILIEELSSNPLNEGGIRVLGPFPDHLIIPEIIFINYKKFKKFTPKQYLDTMIRKIFKHEKEHYLEGPATKFKQKIYRDINKLTEQKKKQEKNFTIVKEMERYVGEQPEKTKGIETEFRKIDFVEKLMKPFMEKLLEEQVELQSAMTDEEIEEAATYISVLNMLYLGSDYAFALGEKLPEYRHPYWIDRYSTIFPSSNPLIIKKLVKKHIEIEDEVLKNIKRGKMEEPEIKSK